MSSTNTNLAGRKKTTQSTLKGFVKCQLKTSKGKLVNVELNDAAKEKGDLLTCEFGLRDIKNAGGLASHQLLCKPMIEAKMKGDNKARKKWPQLDVAEELGTGAVVGGGAGKLGNDSSKRKATNAARREALDEASK